MTQEEIWINHIKNSSVNDVIKEYQSPAIFQRELVELINQRCEKRAKIIEVGCELGVTSLLLDDMFEKTLLDLNPLAINLTKKAHHKLKKKANFVVADMFDMPFKDREFDIIFNAGVIEHFDYEERKKALLEYSRILKDDGVMIIAFPNHYSLPYRLAYMIRKLLNRWPYPEEYKLLDLKKEILSNDLVLEERATLSKDSLMNWLNFIKPLKKSLQFIDKVYNFEGYLTVLIIGKKN